MDQVSTTRSELLARRTRIALATQGRDLLKDRRGALVREFHRLGARALEFMDAVERDATRAAALLGTATALEGPESLAAAAAAAETGIPVALHRKSVAGVLIIELETGRISRARTDRRYSLAATSPRVDAVAERYESALERLLNLAALELSVRRLAEEIARTTRRMNALEHVVLPRLAAESAHIALALDEREMEDRIRLRRGRRSPAQAGRQP